MVAGGSEMNTSFNILAGSLRARSSNTEALRAAAITDRAERSSRSDDRIGIFSPRIH